MSTLQPRRLEAEDLVFQLADWPCLGVAQTLSRLLHGRDHRRWSTNEDLNVVGRCWQLLLDHIGSDEASTTSPVLGWVVQNVVDIELGILGR